MPIARRADKAPPNGQADARFDIANRLFFRLYQASNLMHKTGSRSVAAFGTTTQQWAVLGALSRPSVRGEGMTVKELIGFLLLSRENSDRGPQPARTRGPDRAYAHRRRRPHSPHPLDRARLGHVAADARQHPPLLRRCARGLHHRRVPAAVSSARPPEVAACGAVDGRRRAGRRRVREKSREVRLTGITIKSN